MKLKHLIIASLCLLITYSCDEEGDLISDALSLEGTYTITDAMLYPNADCSGTPSYGICNADESVTVEADCPDNSWEPHILEFEGWNLNFLDDNETVIFSDGMETDTLTYSLSENTLVISAPDGGSETITITLSSDNNTLDATLNIDASCSSDMETYDTEEDCNEAGFEWDEAICGGLTLILSENNDTDTDAEDEENEGPPACVEDCPDFDLLNDCDYDDEDCDANADCAIIASWDGTDCFSDCEGDDADEVNMVLQTCINCIADETDCGVALDDIYDEYDEGPPACVEDCPDFDLLDDCDYDDEDCDANADCAIIASWEGNDCLLDCEGDDANEVSMVLQTCIDCIASETDCAEALDDIYDEDWDDEYDEGPPACVEDCPDFNLILTDFDCDLETGECLDETSICTIIASWEGSDCLSDCTGEDSEEVTMIMQTCTDCITNPDVDCSDALDDMDDDYDENIDCSMYTLINECLEMDGCHYVEEFDADGNAINGWCENEHEGPPSCVEDCPDFNLLDDCDYDDEECDANADCTIVASWEGNDCLLDCEGEDAYEVTMVLQTCIDCIANETDCEMALDDIYDDDTWTDELPEAPACVEDCSNFDVLEGDHNYTDTEVCEFLVQWTDCSSDCEGEDLTLVNDIINQCTACLANNTCDEDMP